jgi:Concanavalin A-like lectin/glucanases superfamily/Bacterial Ig-like domain/Secretion system C-terminal sorting domain
LVAVPSGQGLTFNGTTNYVSTPSHADFNLSPTQSYTWSAWVKNTSFKEWSTVWSQTVDANNFFYFYAHTSTDVDGGPVTNGISVYWWNTGGTNRLGVHSSNNVLTAGVWSYVSVTYDASLAQNNRFTIFVNGVDVTVRTDVSSAGTLQAINATNIRMGANQPFGEVLNGSIDEVRVYKRALTLAEVQSDMNTPIATSIAPTVSPVNGATGVSTTATVTAVFNVDMNAATISSSTIQLRDATNTLVASTVTYNAGTRTATLTPSAPLLVSTVYSAKIIGGASGVKDSGGNAMSGDYNWSFTTADPVVIGPTEGPGGPILVISTTTNPFSRYAVEILRTEGLNEFAAADISAVTAGVLNNYDVVILGEMTVNAAQVTMFTDWVNAGGTLIAFKPSALLTPLLGISTASGTLADKYLLVNTAAGPGVGIVNQTIQFHSTANLHTLSGATSLATLYSTASTATTNPAVTMRLVGSNGGRAVAFTYDLARSIVYTRQGNPAWAGQKRDGQIDPIRSDDMFFPDWIDFNKVAIPQADEQQRLLANIILQSNLHRKPLPRFWYLPRDLKAAIVMTGDDHANNGTPGRFDQYIALGNNTPQDVADWRAVRGSSYMYPGTAITNAQAVSYDAQGFEIALHPNTGCNNYTEASLLSTFNTQLGQFASSYPGIPSPVSNRSHCLVWSDWASQPKVELQKGMRYDVTYYYWPEVWMQNRPGMFTGSGMPMRFADLDGSLIDVYQSPTQMTDETNMNYTTFCNTVLDKAIGSEGYYGVFTTNMHTDNASSAGSDAIIASAQARQIPIISAKQMLTWLDGRNNSYFSNMTWSNNQLTFAIIARSTANSLKAMLPLNSENGTLLSITRSGNSVAFTTQTIKGIAYAFFAPVTGTNTYVATYSSGARIATQPVTEVITATEPVKTTTEESKTITPDSKLYVNVMPNPSINYFNIVIHSNDATPVKVRVMDMFGRVIETHDKVTSASILRIGQTWPSGTYFAEVVQGNQRQIVKFIKAN